MRLDCPSIVNFLVHLGTVPISVATQNYRTDPPVLLPAGSFRTQYRLQKHMYIKVLYQ